MEVNEENYIEPGVEICENEGVLGKIKAESKASSESGYRNSCEDIRKTTGEPM